MSDKQKVYKPKPISGFPEWLPEERLVEQQWFDKIRQVFEGYGFCNIETPSVEEIDVLLAKGEVDKEIYVLERLHKDEDDAKDARLALHFDQTVPFARYTAQHFNELVFPFKRYQMQRVWRGERPQMGRMREFYQCDIDVINVDNLPIAFDAEVAAMAYEALEALNIGRVQLRISNREILFGLMEHFGEHNEEKITLILRALDKLEKLGKDVVFDELRKVPLNETFSKQLLDVCNFKTNSPKELQNHIKNILNQDFGEFSILGDGIQKLCIVLDNLSHLPDHAVVADLSIVRGLDYYTGTVYETQLLDVPEFVGSVCSGGRYDDLASQYINKKLPGVGISIGFTRLFDVIRQSRPDLMNIGAKSPADMLIYTEHKEMEGELAKTAQTLRARGFKIESYHTVKKWEKHVKYTKNKMIPYIWYIQKDGTHEIKNMKTGEQISADPETWDKH